MGRAVGGIWLLMVGGCRRMPTKGQQEGRGDHEKYFTGCLLQLWECGSFCTGPTIGSNHME